jgi:SAM-dependent methyltransferase
VRHRIRSRVLAARELTLGAFEWRQRLQRAEQELAGHPSWQLCEVMGDWPTSEFGRLFLSDLSAYPHIAARLPRMPDPEIQRRFTGHDGAEMMAASVATTVALRRLYEQWSGLRLGDAKVLDYGAGWGRLTRMMLQFVPTDRIQACDAWAPTAEIFDGLGFPFPCEVIDAVPTTLPFSRDSIDFVWVFSVLTHLPAEAGDSVMRALLDVVRPGGIAIVTLRPRHFWERTPRAVERGVAEELAATHRQTGFAHLPADWSSLWGDTSMSIEYAIDHWAPWQVLATEDHRNLQVRVVLRKPLT